MSESSGSERRAKLSDEERAALLAFRVERDRIAAKLGAAYLEVRALEDEMQRQLARSVREEREVGGALARRHGFPEDAPVRFDAETGELVG